MSDKRWDLGGWRKLYRSEPIEQLLWPLLCRGLRDYLIRRAGDDGVLFSSTEDPAGDLCQALGARDNERENVRTCVRTFLDDGFLVHRTDGALVVRNLVFAQTRRTKEAERKAAQRQRKRDQHQNGTTGATVPGTPEGTQGGTVLGHLPLKKERKIEEKDPPLPPEGGHGERAGPNGKPEPPAESGYDLALRCFLAAWRERYGEDYVLSTNTGPKGEHSALQRIGHEAMRHAGEPTMRLWLVAFFADPDPYLVTERHPVRALESRLNKYGTKAAPNPLATRPDTPTPRMPTDAEAAKKKAEWEAKIRAKSLDLEPKRGAR